MFTTIVIAMVALFVLLRLRAELGNRNDEDLQPPEPRFRHPTAHPEAEQPMQPDPVAQVSDGALHDTLLRMHSHDRGFRVDEFLGGAKQAYTMILDAFWTGDRDTLNGFLARDVYEQFEGVIDAREKAEQTIENKILEISAADITIADLNGSVAELTVRFKTDLVAVTRDKDGVAISGDVSNSVEVTDTWTFSRDLRSGDPKWLLIATHAG